MNADLDRMKKEKTKSFWPQMNADERRFGSDEERENQEFLAADERRFGQDGRREKRNLFGSSGNWILLDLRLEKNGHGPHDSEASINTSVGKPCPRVNGYPFDARARC